MAISSRLEIAAAVDAVDGTEPLIPGLPDEIAEHCLLHLPFPHQSQARSVSSAWNRTISDPSFLTAKTSLRLSLPYIFAFAFHRSTFKLQWQAFDPRSHHWFLLPPMPHSTSPPVSPSAFACASNPCKGELFVIGGMRSDTNTPLQTTISYKASTNSWSIAPPMPTARSHFAAGCIGGKIFAAGGEKTSVECFDPEINRWTSAGGEMMKEMLRYDAAVVGKKLYVTEGWMWPFCMSPRGGVYDSEKESWEEMRVGMREGWTGSSVVLEEKLFVISECGDCKVKVYDEKKDTWRAVVGEGVPAELKKPFAVAGLEGKIYVVAAGMNVAVGKVEKRKGYWAVEWEVVTGPKGFADLSPSWSQVLYA